MYKECKPFFINSTYIFSNEYHNNIDSIFQSIGYNNGNPYITYSLIKEIFGYVKQVPHIQTFSRYDFKNQEKDIEYINNECSHVFLVLQDQIRQKDFETAFPYKTVTNFIQKINKPIIVAGFGANHFTDYDKSFVRYLSSELINFLHVLKEHCKCIGLRGEITQEILHHLRIDNTQVIGCPSFYENGPSRWVQKKELGEAVLTAPMRFRIENNPYVCLQDEKNIVSKIFNGDPFLNYYKNYFFSTSIDKWKEFVSKFSFAYGTRMHGAILALNSGVPAVVLNSDLRSQEMCKFMKIPYLPDLQEKSVEELFDACDISTMNEVYPRLYANFVEFMKKNDIIIADQLSDNINHKNDCYDFEIYKTLSQKEISLVEHIESINYELNKLKKFIGFNEEKNDPNLKNMLSDNSYKVHNLLKKIKNGENVHLNNTQIEILQKICNAEKICIYGLGKLFRDNYFDSSWNRVFCADYFSDGDSKKWGKPLDGIYRRCQEKWIKSNNDEEVFVVSPKDLPKDENLLIITYVKDDTSLVKDLNNLGLNNIINIYKIYNIFEEN